jgi:ribosomal protein S18 acetylase RimI-like enzyme
VKEQNPQDQTTLVSGGVELLDRIQNLWEELRRHHAELAPIWKVGLLAPTFADRKTELINKSGGGMLVLLAMVQDEPVGYCVSTIDADQRADVDSLFVSAAHRNRGLGGKLMGESMKWLKDQHVKSIAVDVISGNADALRLYERFGFRTRLMRMRYVEKS